MPLEVLFVENPKKFTLFNLGAYLGHGESQDEREEQNKKALSFFELYGLVPTKETIIHCKVCNKRLGIENDTGKCFAGFRFKCKNKTCSRFDKKISPLKNTIFENAKMPLRDNGKDYFGLSDFLKLMTMWYFNIKVTESQYHCQIGSSATSCKWYHKFREICRVVESHDTGKIGGADDVVEVDESHLYKRKNNKGRTLYSEKHLWVFGGISRKTGKRFAIRVDKRDGETLHPAMSEKIEKGSFIFSDGWRAYVRSPIICGFKGHAWVNHSSGEFVRPYPELIENIHRSLGTRILVEPPSSAPEDPSLREVKVHTNTVERMWRDLKDHLRNVRGDNKLIEDCIGAWLYRRNILDYESEEHGQRFLKFLQDISRVYPGLGKNGLKDPYKDEPCQCCSCITHTELQED